MYLHLESDIKMGSRLKSSPKSLQIRKAISGDQYFCPFPLNHLDALVIVSWTHLTPVPPVVKVIETTSRMCANTDITDEAILQTCFEGRDSRQKNERQNNQSKHHAQHQVSAKVDGKLLVAFPTLQLL